MAYCRWSTNSYQCDLYCYESDQGYITNVASGRHDKLLLEHDNPYGEKGLMLLRDSKFDEWKEMQDHWKEVMDTCPIHPINSPYAGESYCDATLEEFRDRIITLSADPNLNVPDYLIPMINEEIKEQIKERDKNEKI